MLIKRVGTVLFCGAVFLGSIAACGNAGSDAPMLDGKALFEKNCKVCHPDGGNIINPKKTLARSDLAASGISSAGDIVKKMRDPGPGMTKFDKASISDAEADAIAKYILSAF